MDTLLTGYIVVVIFEHCFGRGSNTMCYWQHLTIDLCIVFSKFYLWMIEYLKVTAWLAWLPWIWISIIFNYQQDWTRKRKQTTDVIQFVHMNVWLTSNGIGIIETFASNAIFFAIWQLYASRPLTRRWWWWWWWKF